MRSILFGVSFVAAAAIAATACGGSSSDTAAPPAPAPTGDDTSDAGPPPDAGPKVDNGAPSTNYPAPHPTLPELVNQAGGKVLATPKIYIMTYPAYAHTAEVTQLAQTVGATPYWAATTSEYGIGPIAYAGAMELTGETAPVTITDKQVEAYVNAKVASGALGTPDTSTIYTIFYPSTTTITMQTGPLGASSSCSSFGGYHGNTLVSTADGTKNIAFAVLPTCPAFGGLGELDGLTGAMSHELIEASTDPFPSTNNGRDSAYAQVDQDHFIWNIFGGSESGDLCVPEKNAFFKPSGMDFTVQRTWSNKMAKASHDPCAPNVPGAVYFNSAPVLTETVSLDISVLGGGVQETQGAKIAVGTSKVIEVDLFSDAATSGPWTVKALDTIAGFTQSAPTLDFKWDRTQGLNGEKLHLTVTVKSAGTLVQGAHPFSIESTLGGITQSWPVLVVDQ